MDIKEYIELIKNLPGCHYVADQDQLHYISVDLARLLGYTPADVPPKKLRDVFVEDRAADHFLNHLKPDKDFIEKCCLCMRDDSPVYVEHRARMPKVPGDGSAGIILGSVRSLEVEYAMATELEVFRKLANRLKAGVHVLDRPRPGEREARIIWMNDFEQSLLRINSNRIGENSPNPLYPSDLVMPNEGDRNDVIKLVSAKFAGKKEPTEMRPREFCEAPSEEGVPRPIPVRTQDYFIPGSLGGHPARIVTLVLPLALPPKLVEFLKEKGARAPVLEELGVRSFEKCQRKHTHQIEFRFLNKLFRRENRPGDRTWQELQVRKGLTVGSLPQDQDATWDLLLEKGLNDRDLYPEEIADRFNSDDSSVIGSEKPLEGFEPNPSAPRAVGGPPSDVQFLKIPLVENGIVVGLSGFYWPVAETDKVVSNLLNVFQKEREDVLNDLPELLHVIRKNSEKRFVFVNRQHALEHGKPQHEFIGKTDIQVFEFDRDLAKDYEKDDDRVLAGNVVARYEPHRASAATPPRQVLTIKSPIHGLEGKVNGIQCIYWYEDELAKLLRLTRIGDHGANTESSSGQGAARFKLFVSYARKDREFLVGGQSTVAGHPIVGVERTLSVLRDLHGVHYWFDEHRREDALDPEIYRQIQTSQVFVLLYSPAFFASRYILETELTWIQSRKLSDASARILPIIIQAADYQDSTLQIIQFLRRFPAINEGSGKWRDPVDVIIKRGDEGGFWKEVSEHIRKLLESQQGT